MKDRLPNIVVGIAIVGFLLYKLTHSDYRFGDGNAYFYMADLMLHGKIPYKDFFLADPPVLVSLLAFFRMVFGNSILFYQFLPYIFEVLTAYLIYLLLNWLKNPLAFLAPFLYLFSFTILSTSDFFTGVQLTMLLFVLGLYFSETKRPVLAGVCFALSCLTKLYAVPLVAGYLGYEVFRTWKDLRTFHLSKDLIRIGLGIIGTGVLVLLPFFLFSPRGMLDYLIVHQLNRPSGLDKTVVFSFFLGKEWWILLVGLLGMRFVKASFFASFFLGALFLCLFKDLYYVYLAILMPFLVMGACSFVSWLLTQGENGKRFAGILGILFLCNIYFSLSSYFSDFTYRGHFSNAPEVGAYVKTLDDHPLYGSHEVAPLIALFSGKSLFHNLVDTNGQAFASGALRLKSVSEDAVSSGVYVIARITDRPELGITETGYESFFSKELFSQYCKPVKKFSSTSNESDNYIGIYWCRR